MIKYIGSKRRMVPRIVALAQGVPGARSVLDLFTGTTRVAQGFKRAGFTVTTNDLATYSEVLATAYIAADARAADHAALGALIAELNALEGTRGYFTRTFCEDARYLQPKNGMRVDAIRARIDALAPDQMTRAILLTALLEAADRVDSTTGLQMAYLKGWSARSHRDLELRLPTLIDGTGTALRDDARDVVKRAELDEFDIVYLDPPYNQHSYFNNYHVWETLVRGDEPAAYGVARKREDCRTRRSPFNSRVGAWDALCAVVYEMRARHTIVSFSDEGFLKLDAIQGLLAERFGEVAAIAVPTRRYVGAQIGIHDPRGVVVGEVSHLHNTEWLFIAGPDARAIAELHTLSGEAV